MRFFGLKHKDSSRKTRSSLSEKLAPSTVAREAHLDLTDIKKDARGNVSKESAPGLRDAVVVDTHPVALVQEHQQHKHQQQHTQQHQYHQEQQQQQLHLPSQRKNAGSVAVAGKNPTRTPASPRGNDLGAVPFSRNGSAPERPSRQTPTVAVQPRPKSATPEKMTTLNLLKPRLELINEPSTRYASTPKRNQVTAQSNGTTKSPPKPTVNPQSILHKNAHYAAKTVRTPSKNDKAALSPSAGSPLFSFPSNNPNHRVRFLSSSSVASTEASEVHLMAGAGSVASSNMSSTRDGAENIFDKVLHSVMAEEEARLSAMGMSSSGCWRPDSHPTFASTSESVEEDETSLGLLSPKHLAPIDADTGLEIGTNNKAPINVDTGLEIEFNVDDDYHDINDDQIDESKWNLLNETALNVSQDSVESTDMKVKGLDLKDSRRIRSYNGSDRKPVTTTYNRTSSQGSEHVAEQHSGTGGSTPAGVKAPSELNATHSSRHHQQTSSTPKYNQPEAMLLLPSRSTEYTSPARDSRRNDSPSHDICNGRGTTQVSSQRNQIKDVNAADKWVAFGSQAPGRNANSLATF